MAISTLDSLWNNLGLRVAWQIECNSHFNVGLFMKQLMSTCNTTNWMSWPFPHWSLSRATCVWTNWEHWQCSGLLMLYTAGESKGVERESRPGQVLERTPCCFQPPPLPRLLPSASPSVNKQTVTAAALSHQGSKTSVAVNHPVASANQNLTINLMRKKKNAPKNVKNGRQIPSQAIA